VVGITLPKKIADYLGREPNGGVGNLVLSTGSKPYNQMTTDGVIEILDFSALNFSPLRGDFSSEIRLARMYKDGKVQYLKGGCLAGNLFEALRDAYFSDTTTVHTGSDFGASEGYFGPRYMLFPATISGK